MNVKALQKQLVAAIAMVAVAFVALGSSTYAWYVSNSKVDGTVSNISSQAAGSSLYIAKGFGHTSQDGTDQSSVSEAFGSDALSALYPISTYDATNWYAVKEWSDTANGAKASQFQKISLSTIDSSDAIGKATYTADADAQTYTAYVAANYTVYTKRANAESNAKNMKVYISGITVSGSDAMDDAIRIAVIAGGNTLIYSPVAEIGNGNTKDGTTAQANGAYYGITGLGTETDYYSQFIATEGGTGTVMYADEESTYAKQLDKSKYYLASSATSAGDGKTPFFTLKLDGTSNVASQNVQVLVWLEGTDAQCLSGVVDGKSGLRVQVDFKGLEETATAAPSVTVSQTDNTLKAAIANQTEGTAASYQWYTVDANDVATEISGATGATLDITATGRYKVVVKLTKEGSVTGTYESNVFSATYTAP